MAGSCLKRMRDEATRHDGFFSSALDRLPAELLLPKENGDAESEGAMWQFYKNRKETAPHQVRKEASKRGKRAKFDVSSRSTIDELQQERASDERARRECELAEGGDDGASDGGDDDADGDDDIGDDDEAHDDDEQEEEDDESGDDNPVTTAKRANGAPSSAPPSTLNGGDDENKRESIAALRQRLQSRIEALRAQRKAGENTQSLKRPSRKEKKASAPRKGKQKGSPAGLNGVANSSGKQNGGADSAQIIIAAATDEELQRPLPEDAGDVQFGGLRLPPRKVTGSAAKPGSKKKLLKTMLARAEEDQSKLRELKASADGSRKASKMEWQTVLKTAAGDKPSVTADPKQIRKALKQREKKKEKSTREWAARAKGATVPNQGKKDKRKRDNTGDAKSGTKKAKSDNPSASATGGGGAGFEGRRSGFLNKH